jgi:hypothetical protein
MEPQYNLNRSQENQEDKNPNPPPPHNVNTEIDGGLVILRTLEEQLRETREPSSLLGHFFGHHCAFHCKFPREINLYMILGHKCISTITLVWTETKSKNWAFQNNNIVYF